MTGLRLVFVVAAVMWFSAVAAAAAAADNTNPGPPVLTISSTVAADVPTLVTYNASNNDKADQGHRRMKINVRAAPRQLNGESWIWDTFCFIVPCVATNVTNFAVTIPSDAFPSGDYGYGFTIELFDSVKVGWSLWYGHHDPGFNITGGMAQWTDFEKEHGVWGLGSWTDQLPCSAMSCARDCQAKYTAPYFPYDTEYKAMADCVESCPGLGWDRNGDCIATNVTEAQLTSPSPSTTIGPQDPTTTPDRPSWAVSSSQSLMFRWVIAVVLGAFLL